MPGTHEEKQFWTDRAVCLGEMRKAQMSGVTLGSNDVFVAAGNDMTRRQQAGTVMLGCIASKGYQVTIGGQSSLQAGAGSQ